MTEYYSLRYIYVTDTATENKVYKGLFLYCYKMEAFKDLSPYISFMDKHIISSVRKSYPDSKLKKQEMLADSCWQKWLAVLHKSSIPFYNIPSYDFQFTSQIDIDKQSETGYPYSVIPFYPLYTPYKECPSYPFSSIEFRYPIELTDKFTLFTSGLSQFINNNVFSFETACPKLKLINKYGLMVFDCFYRLFSNRIVFLWPNLMHLEIDVYNEVHLKGFMTNPGTLCNNSILDDSPYTSFCFRPSYNGDSGNDIIENSALCETLHLTVGERYALIAHEIGHFVEAKANGILCDNALEIKCDEYAMYLGLSVHLKSALQKIVDAQICSDSKNQMIIERINRL